jgi:hypothetical protein
MLPRVAFTTSFLACSSQKDRAPPISADNPLNVERKAMRSNALTTNPVRAIQLLFALAPRMRPKRLHSWNLDGRRGESGAELDFVRNLVLRNKAKIFPGTVDSVDIVEIALGPPQYQRGDRYHRSLVVHCRRNGLADTVKLWLKFGPELDQLYPVLAAYHRRLDQQVFPTPYFAGLWPSDDTAFLATAYVGGSLLRDRLIGLGALRRTAQLEPVFRSNGAKMRQFHDAFVSSREIAVTDIMNRATDFVRATPHLAPDEKKTVLALLARCQALLPMAGLPAVLTHNGWALTHIIVTPEGGNYVIDCDTMKHAPTWRWFDIGYLLLNVESQCKWSPLVTRQMICNLWRAFWHGYIGENGVPDGLSPVQLAAVLYIVRIEWLVGGRVQSPYFAILSGLRNQRHLLSLKRSVLRGRYSMCGFLDE